MQTVNSILVVTSYHTKAILELFLKKGKKIDVICFVKIATYFSVPHVMMFTNKCHLCKSYVGQECPNHKAAKSQNFARIKDARVTYTAVKYTGGYLHKACHKSSYLGYFETSFENKEKKDWWEMLL